MRLGDEEDMPSTDGREVYGTVPPSRMVSLATAVGQDGRSLAWIRKLCAAGRIPGAQKMGRDWMLPAHTRLPKPPRGRPRSKKP